MRSLQFYGRLTGGRSKYRACSTPPSSLIDELNRVAVMHDRDNEFARVLQAGAVNCSRISMTFTYMDLLVTSDLMVYGGSIGLNPVLCVKGTC